jgi:hypothetical protein
MKLLEKNMKTCEVCGKLMHINNIRYCNRHCYQKARLLKYLEVEGTATTWVQ